MESHGCGAEHPSGVCAVCLRFAVMGNSRATAEHVADHPYASTAEMNGTVGSAEVLVCASMGRFPPTAKNATATHCVSMASKGIDAKHVA